MIRDGISVAAIGLVFTLCLGFSPLRLAAADRPPTFANLQGEVVLDNPRVIVEKFVLQPGQSTGEQSHRRDQLWVFVKGGVLTSSEGRATLWRDGRVSWRSASDRPEAGSTNTGATPIELVCVNLKPVPAAPKSSSGRPKYRYLNYPNIPGEDLLENDWVIVQRFTVNPGQWEGVHAHHPTHLLHHLRMGIGVILVLLLLVILNRLGIRRTDLRLRPHPNKTGRNAKHHSQRQPSQRRSWTKYGPSGVPTPVMLSYPGSVTWPV